MTKQVELVATGETGELVVKSPYIAEGYWHRPEETAAVFKPDPEVPGQRIYRTGDLGRFLPDGSFVFLGRRDRQVKIRGFRVETREIESALLQLNEVSEAAIIVGKEEDEDRLIAFVVFKNGVQFDPSALRERLRAYLPEWKIPARFQSISWLPTTLTGKVDRQQLEKQLHDSLLHKSSGTGTPATIEEKLADIWRVTLRLDAVGFDDNYLDLGGNSISIMMTLSWIERLYGIRIAPPEFFHRGTIRQLAELIKNKMLKTDYGLRDRGEVHCATAEITPAPGASLIEAGTLQRPLLIDNVSDGYLELLNAHDVDYIFINPGSGTAPIQESIAKFHAQGRRTPKLILCLHESVAMAAAHGYFMVCGKPQVVLVHVDVGTQNIGANLHNAQRGRAGVVVCAGRSPYTVDGSLTGGRNRYIDWIQEPFNQASTVQDYVKWHYELTCRENLSVAVQRAFQVAGTEPAGPVYLTLPREVLMEKIGSPDLRAPTSAGDFDANA